jgi:hypothetical protein
MSASWYISSPGRARARMRASSSAGLAWSMTITSGTPHNFSPIATSRPRSRTSSVQRRLVSWRSRANTPNNSTAGRSRTPPGGRARAAAASSRAPSTNASCALRAHAPRSAMYRRKKGFSSTRSGQACSPSTCARLPTTVLFPAPVAPQTATSAPRRAIYASSHAVATAHHAGPPLRRRVMLERASGPSGRCDTPCTLRCFGRSASAVGVATTGTRGSVRACQGLRLSSGTTSCPCPANDGRSASFSRAQLPAFRIEGLATGEHTFVHAWPMRHRTRSAATQCVEGST